MKCPYCNGQLVEGEASVAGTIGGLLLFGLSWQHLWFKVNGDDKKQEIISSNRRKKGMQCSMCGAIVIPKDLKTQLKVK
jgi:hypothetical protein